jgi:hypothetical protein
MIAISAPHYAEVAGLFRWEEGEIRAPFRMVLLAEDYRPLAEFDGIASSPWRPDGPLAELLTPGSRYHAYLLASHLGRVVKSPLTTFVWQ